MTFQPLNELLKKEVDRKEFLLYAGLILLAITGVSGALKNISLITKEPKQKGFGSGPYGK